MVIKTETGIYQLQGPPNKNEIKKYWDLSKIKFINFDKLSTTNTKEEQPFIPDEIPEVIEPPIVKEVVIELPKEIKPEIIKQEVVEYTEYYDKIANSTGNPVLYKKNNIEYKIYCRMCNIDGDKIFATKALDFQETVFLDANTNDTIKCEWDNSYWTIKKIFKLKEFICFDCIDKTNE